MKIPPAQRNQLAAAWHYSEALYDNAVALNQMLDAYSKRDPGTELNQTAIEYIAQILASAKFNAALLEAALDVALGLKIASHPTLTEGVVFFGALQDELNALLQAAPQSQPDEVQHA